MGGLGGVGACACACECLLRCRLGLRWGVGDRWRELEVGWGGEWIICLQL